MITSQAENVFLREVAKFHQLEAAAAAYEAASYRIRLSYVLPAAAQRFTKLINENAPKAAFHAKAARILMGLERQGYWISIHEGLFEPTGERKLILLDASGALP